MHQQLEEFIASQSRMYRTQARVLAKPIDATIPASQDIIALHKGKRHLAALTPTTLYLTNGGKVESVQLSAVTAVKQKALKTVVETSTEKITITPGTDKFFRLDTEALLEFAKAIREAL